MFVSVQSGGVPRPCDLSVVSPQTQPRLRNFAIILYHLMLVVFGNFLACHHIIGDLFQVSLRLPPPLYYLTKKLVTFCWTDKCQKAFDKLKQLLCSAPVLAYPLFGPEHLFILETDASVLGLGAILSQ